MRFGWRNGVVAAFLGIGLIAAVLDQFSHIWTGKNGLLSNLNISSEINRDVMSIAHRGASGYAPENTMAAFEKAYHMGANMIELDVQLSKDDQVVVIHDTKVNRTSNGKGMVHNKTLNQLRKLDAGSWYSSKFRGQRIPTLEDVLRNFGGKIPLLIEMKSYTEDSGIERKVAELIHKYDQQLSTGKNHNIIVQSFDIKSLKLFHEISPEVPIAVITSSAEEIEDTSLMELAQFAQYLTVSRSLLSEDNVQRIKRAGLKVLVWNIDKEIFNIPFLMQSGISGIITDYPDIVPTNMSDRF